MPDALPTATVPPVVYLTIWAALTFYTVGEYGRTRWFPAVWARPIWLLGGLLYLAHVTAAFGIYHGWSHTTAYDYTAAQTEAFMGLPWGGGLWMNYLFTAVWIAEGFWWEFLPAHFARRSAIWTTTIRCIFFFMIANGAVIFVGGPGRLLGIGLLVALVWIWRTSTASDSRGSHHSRLSPSAWRRNRWQRPARWAGRSRARKRSTN